MRIPDLPLDPAQIAEFTRCGYWTETTSNDALEHLAGAAPDRLAIVDGRMRLGYGDYFRRAERLAAYLAGLGLGDYGDTGITVRGLRDYGDYGDSRGLRGDYGAGITVTRGLR